MMTMVLCLSAFSGNLASKAYKAATQRDIANCLRLLSPSWFGFCVGESLICGCYSLYYGCFLSLIFSEARGTDISSFSSIFSFIFSSEFLSATVLYFEIVLSSSFKWIHGFDNCATCGLELTIVARQYEELKMKKPKGRLKT